MAAKDIEAGRAHVLIQLRDKVTAGLQRVERSVAGFGRNFATLGTAFAASGAGALAWPLKMSAEMEQLDVAFEVLLGGAGAAREMMAELAAFAKRTPFGLQDVSENAQLLLNFGVSAKQILPDLQSLGDVSAGNAEKFKRLALAYGQAQSKGRLMGQEVLQMTEAGFNPLQQISQMTGKSVKQLSKEMEEGQISTQMLTAAFRAAAGPGGRFHGMMDKQSKTLTGLLSTLLDAVSFGIKPLGDAAAEVLKPLASFAIGAAEAFQAFAERNKGLMRVVAGVLLGLTAVGGVLAAIGFGALAFSVVLGGLAAAFSAVMTAVVFLISPIGALIASLVAAGVAGYMAFGAVREAIDDVTTALLSGDFATAGTIAMLGLNAAIFSGVEQIGMAISAGLDFLQSWIPAVGSVRDFMAAAFGSIYQAILAGRWDLAGQIMMTKLQIVWLTGWNFLKDSFDLVITGIKSAWISMSDFLSNIWTGAINGIARGVVWIMEKIGLASAGTMAELKRMQEAEAKARQAARDKRADPNDQMYARMNERQKQLDAMRAQLGQLEGQAAKAHADAGAPTLGNVAAQARKEFFDSLDLVKQHEEQAKKGAKPLGNQVSMGNQQAGKVATMGTFSGAAASLALGINSRPNEETAKNTAGMLRWMKQRQAGQAAFS